MIKYDKLFVDNLNQDLQEEGIFSRALGTAALMGTLAGSPQDIEAKANVPSTSAVSKSFQQKTAAQKLEERRIEILAKTIYTEAAGESFKGKQAVASIIYNRSKHRSWRDLNISGICRQKFQFSGWNKGEPRIKLNNPQDKQAWADSVKIATEVVKGIFKPLPELNGMVYYYNPNLASPSWGNKLTRTTTIGKHKFGAI